MATITLNLPPGWKYTVSVPARSCSACGHTEPEKPGVLRDNKGREWPLVGNKTLAQERDMVHAIIAANVTAERGKR